MRDEKQTRGIFFRIAIALDREVAAVADDVGVGHDAIAADEKAGADATLDAAGIPRRLVIGLHFRAGDANDAVLDPAVRLRRGLGEKTRGREDDRAEQEATTIHAQEVQKMGQMDRKSNPGAVEEGAENGFRLEDFAGEGASGAGVVAVIGVDHFHGLGDLG